MLAAFATVAYTARRQWHEKRFSDLYLDETRCRSEGSACSSPTSRASRRASRLRADGRERDAKRILRGHPVPMFVNECGGVVDKLIDDAIMVSFNTRGDQPDHVLSAVRAGLALRRETGRVECHREWPRFRVSVNSGEVMVGLVGAEGRHSFMVIGDTVNLASRLEGKKAPAETYVVELPPDGS